MVKQVQRLFAVAMMSVLVLGAGCSDRNPADLDVARARIDPLVFDDDYGADVYFQAFSQTHLTAVSLDSTYAFGGYAGDGARSLKINVPPAGSALGLYSGGVLTSAASRDLADFNALTFYARADADVVLNTVGFGNDNTGTSRFEAGRNYDSARRVGGIPLTREWVFHVVPIPAPSKLVSERGMLTFAEGLEDAYPEGYNIWLDEIRFAKLDNVNVYSPSMTPVERAYFIGSTVSVGDTRTVFDVDGERISVDHSPNYFDYVSSNLAVAVVSAQGRIKVIGEGDASITGTLEGKEVFGSVDVTGYPPPTTTAADPTAPADEVISMFSGVYDDVAVETWASDWNYQTTRVEDFEVAGNETKMYSAFNFVGILFHDSLIDASAMNYLHLDVFAPAGTDFKVKLVSLPPAVPGARQTPDLILDAGTMPAFRAGTWSSLDIPLAAFQLPPGWDWSTVGELVLSTSDVPLVLVDNVYWHE